MEFISLDLDTVTFGLQGFWTFFIWTLDLPVPIEIGPGFFSQDWIWMLVFFWFTFFLSDIGSNVKTKIIVSSLKKQSKIAKLFYYSISCFNRKLNRFGKSRCRSSQS